MSTNFEHIGEGHHAIVVDDHEMLRNLHTSMLEERGFTVESHENYEELIPEAIQKATIMLMDNEVGKDNISGREFAEQHAANTPETTMIMVSSSQTEGFDVTNEDNNIAHVQALPKPLIEHEGKLNIALAKAALSRSQHTMENDIQDIATSLLSAELQPNVTDSWSENKETLTNMPKGNITVISQDETLVASIKNLTGRTQQTISHLPEIPETENIPKELRNSSAIIIDSEGQDPSRMSALESYTEIKSIPSSTIEAGQDSASATKAMESLSDIATQISGPQQHSR